MLDALAISSNQDLAGIGGRWVAAARQHPEAGVRIRSVHRLATYLDFPADLYWTDATQGEVQRLYDAADVVHLNYGPRAYQIFDRGQRKPVLLNHHGTLFRRDPVEQVRLARANRWVAAASTIDLLRHAPDEIAWLPAPYDLEALAALRPSRTGGPVRIVHAPTDRAVKSTGALIGAVDELRAEGLAVELDVIEGVPWRECLRRKADGDVCFDQVQLGYGCNAIEAWGMGMPVIAGADEWTLGRMRAEFGGDLPFYAATEETIVDALRALVVDEALRAEWADRGRAHAARFHAEAPALERLVSLYRAAIARRRRRVA